MRKRLLLTTICIILLLSGCVAKNKDKELSYVEVGKSEMNQIQPKPGGSLVIPIYTYETLNPLYPTNSSMYYFYKLIYDSLFQYSSDGTLESNIVEHYSLSPDKKTLTLTLKDNLIWHNGDKMTTEDVLATFNYIKNSPSCPYYDNFLNAVGRSNVFDSENFLSMDIFDERNLDLHFDKPYADYLDMLTFPILPKNEVKNLANDESSNIDLIGSGPYKVKSIKESDNIELVQFENYHNSMPYIMNINAKIFDDDEFSNLAFETGQIDITVAKDYDWAKYRDNGRIKIEEYDSNEMDILVINNLNPIFSGDSGRKIRQSISRAINKKRIIDRLYLGKATETSIPVNLSIMKYYNLKSDTYYNENMAKELLAEVGYNKLNENGLLTDENGNTINLEIKSNFSDPYKKMASDFVVQDLRAVGINAVMNYNSDNETIGSKISKDEDKKFFEDLKSGNFDLALISINLTDIPDIGALLHTSSIKSGFNYGYYSNPNLDLIIDNLKYDNDYDVMREYYLSVIDIYSNDMPIVPLYIKKKALLIDEKLEGNINPIVSDIYRSFRNVFILLD